MLTAFIVAAIVGLLLGGPLGAVLAMGALWLLIFIISFLAHI